MTPEVSAIVVDHHVPELPRAVESLVGLRGVRDIHVVDNGGGTDWSGLRALTQGTSVRLVGHEFVSNPGFGAAVNRAAAATDRDVLLLLNPDAIVTWWDLERSLVLMRESRAAVLGPNIVDPQGRAEPSAGKRQSAVDLLRRAGGGESRVKRPFSLDPDEWVEAGWVSAAAMLLDRQAFAEVGGFDDRYFLYYEDMDLCRRLERAGWSILRAGHGEVVHEVGGARRSAVSQRSAIARSLWRYLRSG